MISQPALLHLNKQYYLVQITKNRGNIVDLHGPYKAISEPGATPEEFIRSLINISTQALHGSEPLSREDLPEELQKIVDEALNVKSD